MPEQSTAVHGDSGARVGGAQIIVCSCGVPGCSELGWPHEWDPIACGDACGAQEFPPHQIMSIGPDGRLVNHTPLHKVREPYVRWGSGYACVECVETCS